MIPLSVLALMVVNVVTLNKLNEQHTQIESQQASIIKTKTQLKTTSESLKRVEGEKTTIDASLKQEREKSQGLEQENQSLKANLQAKKEAEAKQAAAAAPAQTSSVQVKAPAVSVTGDKQSWLAASGIPQSEWTYVDYIVNRESGWNPNAVNASSGACGLGQQLPCGKWAGAWNDPVAALQAMDGYAKGRYGSWAGAYSAWISKNWW